MKPIAVCGLLFIALAGGTLLGTWQQSRRDARDLSAAAVEAQADRDQLAAGAASLAAARHELDADNAEIAAWKAVNPRVQTPEDLRRGIAEVNQQFAAMGQTSMNAEVDLNTCRMQAIKIQQAQQAEQTQGPQAALALLAKLLLR